MTDTQAKSGTASAATDEAGEAGEAAMTGSDSGAPAAGGEAGAVNGNGVVGETTSGGTPKFTRAPGMAPPPDSLTVPIQSPASVVGSAGVKPVSGSATGTASVSAIARAAVRTPAAATQAINAPAAPASGSARVTEAVRAARKTVSSAVGRGPRRARLHLKRIDPWSVMKFAFAVSFVLFVVVIVATSVLYLALDAMDVFNSVNNMLKDIVSSTGGESNSTFRITAKGVIGGAALLGVVNVVLFTALATLGSFIYNVCADLVGGIELTLAEKD
ncbi:DUF3566 domain-containing protein [Dactylosporangium sucinum]|uniref:DUF3566 domain-containing protein n=1 Tax=Dactylosporangium sucinum TaxID=1424081 RepID=A0A917T6F5_9ACTN|nr:DUF3566 domain-containing protein [Dactylosporangium sucinum]GGM09829.1 hypothetical protein GCM10007977_008750 [Dactylosporangium sucinum]